MSSYSAFSGLPLPAWQTFVPNIQGVTGPTVNVARYAQIGKIAWLFLDVDGGTATQTYRTFTLPVSLSSIVFATSDVVFLSPNGMAIVGFDSASETQNAAVCSLFPDAAGDNWPSSGTWGGFSLSMFYETN